MKAWSRRKHPEDSCH